MQHPVIHLDQCVGTPSFAFRSACTAGRLSLLHQMRVVRRGLAGGAGVVRRRERERAAAGGDAEALLALPRR